MGKKTNKMGQLDKKEHKTYSSAAFSTMNLRYLAGLFNSLPHQKITYAITVWFELLLAILNKKSEKK